MWRWKSSCSTRGLLVFCTSPPTSILTCHVTLPMSSSYFGLRVLLLLLLPYWRERLRPLSKYSILVTFVRHPTPAVSVYRKVPMRVQIFLVSSLRFPSEQSRVYLINIAIPQKSCLATGFEIYLYLKSLSQAFTISE